MKRYKLNDFAKKGDFQVFTTKWIQVGTDSWRKGTNIDLSGKRFLVYDAVFEDSEIGEESPYYLTVFDNDYSYKIKMTDVLSREAKLRRILDV